MSDVEQWFADRRPVQEPLMRAVRAVILGVDDRITESIKWKTPTFAYEGNIASFNPAKKLVSLLFHTGAKIPGEHPRLEGDGDVARVFRIHTEEELGEARAELEAVIRSWVEWKSS